MLFRNAPESILQIVVENEDYYFPLNQDSHFFYNAGDKLALELAELPSSRSGYYARRPILHDLVTYKTVTFPAWDFSGNVSPYMYEAYCFPPAYVEFNHDRLVLCSTNLKCALVSNRGEAYSSYQLKPHEYFRNCGYFRYAGLFKRGFLSDIILYDFENFISYVISLSIPAHQIKKLSFSFYHDGKYYIFASLYKEIAAFVKNFLLVFDEREHFLESYTFPQFDVHPSNSLIWNRSCVLFEDPYHLLLLDLKTLDLYSLQYFSPRGSDIVPLSFCSFRNSFLFFRRVEHLDFVACIFSEASKKTRHKFFILDFQEGGYLSYFNLRYKYQPRLLLQFFLSRELYPMDINLKADTLCRVLPEPVLPVIVIEVRKEEIPIGDFSDKLELGVV